VAEGDALAYGTWYWRVRAKDPLGTNTYGDWTTARHFHLTSSSPDKTVSVDKIALSSSLKNPTLEIQYSCDAPFLKAISSGNGLAVLEPIPGVEAASALIKELKASDNSFLVNSVYFQIDYSATVDKLGFSSSLKDVSFSCDIYIDAPKLSFISSLIDVSNIISYSVSVDKITLPITVNEIIGPTAGDINVSVEKIALSSSLENPTLTITYYVLSPIIEIDAVVNDTTQTHGSSATAPCETKTLVFNNVSVSTTSSVSTSVEVISLDTIVNEVAVSTTWPASISVDTISIAKTFNTVSVYVGINLTVDLIALDTVFNTCQGGVVPIIISFVINNDDATTSSREVTLSIVASGGD